MPQRPGLEVSVRSGLGKRTAERPWRVLILAGLSGSSSASADSLAPRRVSVETIDDAIAAFNPRIRIDLDGPVSVHDELVIKGLDDFHPDHLVTRIPALHELLESSTRHNDPVAPRPDLPSRRRESETASGAPPKPSSAADEDPEQLLERLLGRRSAQQSDGKAKQVVQSLIRDALGSTSSARSPEPTKPGGQQTLDVLTRAMRAILTHDDFREVERAWRSVHWLASRLDQDQAELHVADLSKQALHRHVEAHASRLDRAPLSLLLDGGSTGEKWDAVVADYTFRLDASDLVLLTTIGAIAGRASVPFLAHGDLSLCGCGSDAEAEAPWDWSIANPDLAQLWKEVRSHPAANWIGLSTPRFLLRQPFGERTDAVESFAFGELPPRPSKELFLWGNPAFACAYLLASVAERGAGLWPLRGTHEVPSLPVPIYDDGGGQAVRPPIEVILTDRARAAVEQNGLTAFVGSGNADYVVARAIGPLRGE